MGDPCCLPIPQTAYLDAIRMPEVGGGEMVRIRVTAYQTPRTLTRSSTSVAFMRRAARLRPRLASAESWRCSLLVLTSEGDTARLRSGDDSLWCKERLRPKA